MIEPFLCAAWTLLPAAKALGPVSLIGIGGGDCVLLAHLRQGSVLVLPGQQVMPGVPVARLGNSGRSTQPHLHLHVQRGDWLGAPTRPFHLAGFVGDDGRLVLDGTPARGAAVTNPTPNAGLSQALRLAPGRQWRFAVPGGDWTLAVMVGLYGETELVSNRGGRILASHIQRGQHRLAALGGAIRAESVGLLSETEGPVGFRLAVPGREDIGRS